MDNLSTHTAGALYETFPAPEAHRILQRLEFHYTPKHASWLNMVEIEIGVLRGQCLDRRIGEREVLVTEIEAWQRQRNASGARIKWKFTTQKARDKLARAYPDTAKESESLCRGALMFAVSSSRCVNSLLHCRLFSMAVPGQSRRHDHETTVDHALIRGLVTAGPVIRRGASSV